ncbi:MAG: hypothetical protein IKB34_06570 [Clostridia bacterium]|nr:hypothetical protein [Clostridia bacterium]
MKIIRRMLAVALTLALLLGSLVGCGVLKGDDAIVYGDYSITEVMYQYWVRKYKTLFLYIYNNSVDTESFWTTEIEEDYTYEDFIVDYICAFAKQVLVSMQLFDEHGLSFTAEQKQGVEDRINELIESYGGKNVLNEELGEMGLNIKTLEKIYYEEAKLDAVIEYFFGKNGVLEVNDNDREAYYKDNYYCAKWIYIYTEVKLKTDDKGNFITDENGVYKFEELTELEKKEKERIVSTLEKEIAAGGNFEALRDKYSEEGLSYYVTYPDGIILSANDYENYGTDMIEAISTTKIGDYSKFNNGYATVFVKRYDLKDYAKLTDAEKKLLVDFEDLVKVNKSDEFFANYEVEYKYDVLARYDIKTIKGASNTSI